MQDFLTEIGDMEGECSEPGEITKRQLQKEIETVRTVQKRKWCLYWMKPICWGRKLWKNSLPLELQVDSASP